MFRSPKAFVVPNSVWNVSFVMQHWIRILYVCSMYVPLDSDTATTKKECVPYLKICPNFLSDVMYFSLMEVLTALSQDDICLAYCMIFLRNLPTNFYPL